MDRADGRARRGARALPELGRRGLDAFNPDGTLDVVWTRNTDPTTCGTVTVRDIYFARSH